MCVVYNFTARWVMRRWCTDKSNRVYDGSGSLGYLGMLFTHAVRIKYILIDRSTILLIHG